MNKRTVGVLGVVLVVALLFMGYGGAAQATTAAPNIVDPSAPVGLVNLFAGVPAGDPIRAGLALPNGCTVTAVDLPEGYLNRGENGAYAVGKGWKQVAIKCEPEVNGIFAYGDNDHYPLSTVCFDDICWTPPFGADTWHTQAFQGVRYFTITSYGDSGFFTAFVGATVGTSIPDGGTPTGEPPTFTPTPTSTPVPPTPTKTPPPPPTKTPAPTATPGWDKSSVKVDGRCVQGEPRFKISNEGAAMQGPSRYWFVNGHASANTCGSIPEDPTLGGGDFQLGANMEIMVIFPKGDLAPPYSICVAQRPGHPGTGYAAATVGSGELCPTAEDVVGEPGSFRPRLFIPLLRP